MSTVDWRDIVPRGVDGFSKQTAQDHLLYWSNPSLTREERVKRKQHKSDIRSICLDHGSSKAEQDFLLEYLSAGISYQDLRSRDIMIWPPELKLDGITVAHDCLLLRKIMHAF